MILDLKTDSESLPMTVAGSEFQTDGAAHRKERFAESVRASERWDEQWPRTRITPHSETGSRWFLHAVSPIIDVMRLTLARWCRWRLNVAVCGI